MKNQIRTEYNDSESQQTDRKRAEGNISELSAHPMNEKWNVIQADVRSFNLKNRYISERMFGKFDLQRVFAALVVLFLVLVSGTHARGADEYRQMLQRGVEAGMDADGLETVISRARDRQIGPEQLDQLLTPAISLAEADLPYHSVLQKAMEGMAKRVPPDNIRNVLNQMTEGLNRSATIIDDWMQQERVRSSVISALGDRDEQIVIRQLRNQLLENTSYALQQDIGEDAIRNFLSHVISENVIDQSGLSPVASAVRAFPDLPTSRDDPASSNIILIRALKSGFSAGEIQQLPDALRSAKFRSEMPAEHIARGMNRQMEEGVPSEHILKNLFQGNVRGGPPGFAPPGLGGDGDEGRGRGRDRRPDEPPGGPPDDPPGGPPDSP